MNLPNEIRVTYNRNIVLGIGNVKVYKDGALFLTFTESDVTIVDNYFTIDTTNLIPDNGEYRVEVSQGLIISIFNETFPLFFWLFSVEDGEFDSNDFNNDFLID
jgi:hypothetical protein